MTRVAAKRGTGSVRKRKVVQWYAKMEDRGNEGRQIWIWMAVTHQVQIQMAVK